MKFIFEDSSGKRIEIVGLSEYSGYEYARRKGYTVVEVADINPTPSEPTEEDDVNGMLVDHEYRLTLLELGITEEV